jgi:multisubunit Na+/H+ antiporter MnhE subunit
VSARKAIARLTAAASLLMGLWLLLTFTVQLAQLVVGAIAALLVAGLTFLAWRGGSRVAVRPGIGWLAEAARLPWLVLRDSGALVSILWQRVGRGRQVRGRLESAHLPLARDRPASVARKVLAVLAGSFAPNTYVVEIDDRRRRVLFHRLAPSGRLPPGTDEEEGTG